MKIIQILRGWRTWNAKILKEKHEPDRTGISAMGGWEGENVNQTAPLGKGNRPGELSWTFIKQHQGAGLEIMAGQLTMPRLIGDLTGQLFVLPVMLRCHIWSCWKWKKIKFPCCSVVSFDIRPCSASLCTAALWSEIWAAMQLEPLFTINTLPLKQT